MIRLENIKKSFLNKKVLDGISLTIPSKEIFFIIGKSGEGKSVLCKIISGILSPDEGDVIVNNKKILSFKDAIEEKITFVFQQSALFDSMTIYENLLFPLRHKKIPTDKKRKIILEYLHLIVGKENAENILQKFPHEISLGMKKLIAIIRSILTFPNTIIYDEPTTGISPSIAPDVMEAIKKVHQKLELTTIVVSHDIIGTIKTASKIAYLTQGKIKTIISPIEISSLKDIELKHFLFKIQEAL